jgi:predicted nucleic acid-binding protein
VPGRQRNAVETVYWDACIFLSLFDGGRGRSTEEVQNLNFWVDVVNEGEATVLTSVLTLTEVLDIQIEGGLTAEQYADCERLIHNSDKVHLYDVSYGIIRRTKELREHAVNNALRPKLTVPDAIHLATASLARGCTAFHTFDGAGEKPGLIHLNGLFPSVPTVCTPAPFRRATARMGDTETLDLLRSLDPRRVEGDDRGPNL